MAVEEEEEKEGNPDDAAAEKSGTEAVPFEWPWICHSQDPTPILISVALSCIGNFNGVTFSQVPVRRSKKDKTSYKL